MGRRRGKGGTEAFLHFYLQKDFFLGGGGGGVGGVRGLGGVGG